MKSKFFLERLGTSYSVRLNEGTNTVGRAVQSTVKITGSFGSRYHCNIIIDNDKVTIQDLNSSNGTFINEQEFKGESVDLQVNDKIGIGVHSVDSFLNEDKYHVYILRKIIFENNSSDTNVNKDENESVCIEISDSDNDDDETILKTVYKESNRRPGPKCKTELNVENLPKKNSQRKEDERQISVAIPSSSKSKHNLNLDRKNSQQSDQDEKETSVGVASSSNLKLKSASNFLRQISQKSKQDEKQTSVAIPLTSNFLNIPNDKNGLKKVNDILKIPNEKVLENVKMNSGSNIETDLKKNDFEKDETNNDYDFQSDEFSQAVWDEIKQEIADLDFSELQSNDDDLNNLKNDLPVKDILDLTLDDDALKNEEEDDDFDLTTRQWFMKLSQNFDDSLEKKSKKDYVNELNTKSDDESLFDKRKTESKLNLATEDDPSSLDKKDKERNSEIINTVGTRSVKNVEESLKKNELSKTSKRSNILIDALSLPSRKGKRKIESVKLSNEKTKISPAKFNKNKTPTKDIRALYSTNCSNNLKLQKKWLEKPNVAREKAKVKQIKDKRKEKLKQLADKNEFKEKCQELETKKKTPEKRKLSISVDELNDDERNQLIKKVKVKITNKNRGAFLTELSKEPTRKIQNQTSSSETSTKEKDEFSKAITSVDCILNKFDSQKNRKKSIEKPIVNQIERTKCPFENIKNVTYSDKEQNFKIPKLPLKSNENLILRSCLKSLDNIISKNKKKKKSVKFNSEPTVHTYEIELEVEQNIEQNKISNKNVMQPALSDFESRRRIWKLKSSQNTGIILDDILTDILSWKPEWLSDEKANVNVSKIVYPMLHTFKTFEDYKRIVFPLMKLELWERLIKDKRNSPNKYIDLNLKKIEIEDKTSEKRIIYTCEYTNSCPLNKPLFYISELVLIKILNKESIFGHVRNSHCFNPTSNSSKVYSIQLESNLNTNLLHELKRIKVIQIQKVSIISTELGAFEAVKKLCFSPLLKKILNPSVLQNDDVIADNKIKMYKYNGYDKLNEVQQKILMNSYLLSINPLKDNITLIEGPPGTGKSKLITNLILQLQYGLELKQLDRKILLCAQSNTAVDVITLKLIRIRQKMDKKKFRLVRYGVLEKMHPEVKPYSLTELIKLQKRSTMKNPEMISLMEEKELLEKKIINLENKRRSNTRDDHDLDKAKTDLNRIKNSLSQQFNDIDRNLENKFLANATIICTTLSSCVRLLRYCNFFDVCIIDEATQCSEPWTLVPLQFGINSLVLIGDTQQLPATTLSNLSKKYNYGKSLFTRAKEVLENVDESIIMSLKIQYRMHPEICKWPNSYFYKNGLSNGEITTNFKVLVKPYSIIELNFSQNKKATNGIENCSEANFIVKLVQGLVKIMPTNIFHYGIITPYNLHCQKLREKLRKEKIEMEVNTIDSYQGKERDIIIISNARTEGIGFLNEICRLNVALTRARKCLILCGNFQQLSNINVWKSLLSDAKRRNIYFEPKESEMLDFQNKIIGWLKL